MITELMRVKTLRNLEYVLVYEYSVPTDTTEYSVSTIYPSGQIIKSVEKNLKEAMKMIIALAKQDIRDYGHKLKM